VHWQPAAPIERRVSRTRLQSEAQTIEFASQYARSLEPGSVVALHGDLGAGKSVFCRAVMRALGVTDAAMPSPTFSIIQEYDGDGCKLAHMDWYRLEGGDELDAIGIRDYMQPPWICLIEWPGRAPELLDDATRHIKLACGDEASDIRLIEVS